MIGAEAVVDIQEERTSASSSEKWSASGNAILAVSESDHLRLLSRWFEGEVEAATKQCLLFMILI
jgi:hypothetical protein